MRSQCCMSLSSNHYPALPLHGLTEAGAGIKDIFAVLEGQASNSRMFGGVLTTRTSVVQCAT